MELLIEERNQVPMFGEGTLDKSSPPFQSRTIDLLYNNLFNQTRYVAMFLIILDIGNNYIYEINRQ